MKVEDLFDVTYGVNLELNKCTLDNTSKGINFVSRTSKNNGISAKVERIENIKPQPAGVLTCATGGSVLSTFVQTEPFYSGRDLYILTPKKNMSFNEKLFYAMCIKSNSFKYSYGRQANKTLHLIELPDTVPSWVYDIKISPLKSKNIMNKKIDLNIKEWKLFSLTEIFDNIYKAKSSDKVNIETSDIKKDKYIEYITRTSENNGLDSYTNDKSISIEEGNAITGAGEGIVFFYHKEKFTCGTNITVLRSSNLNKYTGLFLVTLLNFHLDKKYSYGRAITPPRLKKDKILLPQKNNKPDWLFMEKYIKSLYNSDLI